MIASPLSAAPPTPLLGYRGAVDSPAMNSTAPLPSVEVQPHPANKMPSMPATRTVDRPFTQPLASPSPEMTPPSAETPRPIAPPSPLPLQGEARYQLVYQDISMGDVQIRLDQGRMQLPLLRLAHLLDFPIHYNSRTGRAEGWFIYPQNVFMFEASAQEKKALKAKKSSADIYVDSALVGGLWPIDFMAEHALQRLYVLPRQTIPALTRLEQIRLLREQLEIRRLQTLQSQEWQ